MDILVWIYRRNDSIIIKVNVKVISQPEKLIFVILFLKYKFYKFYLVSIFDVQVDFELFFMLF